VFGARRELKSEAPSSTGVKLAVLIAKGEKMAAQRLVNIFGGPEPDGSFGQSHDRSRRALEGGTSASIRMAGIAVALVGALLLATAASAQTAISGYAVSDFGTGFANTAPMTGAGPVGLAFDKTGSLYVMDYATGFLYKFGPTGGVASSSTQVNAQAIPGAPAGIAFTKDGSLYAARQANGDVVQLDPSSGAVMRVVASVPGATGIAVDPLSGDLFVTYPFSTANTIYRISNFAGGVGTATVYASVSQPDGIVFGPDGTIYVALLGVGGIATITGTNSSAPGTATTISVTVPSIDGMAVSANPSAPFLFGNRNDGVMTRVDLSTSTPNTTDIFSGGSRGDFLAVGPDGCIYATQTDRVVKVTNADGSCLSAPLGPLFPTNPVATNVSFSAFCAELEGEDEHEHGFELHARFMLGTGSNGINPVSEAVTLELGGGTMAVPAGSFVKTHDGAFAFDGTVGSVHLKMRITPSKNVFHLTARGQPVDPSALVDPVTVALTIGDDAGTTAAFDQREDDDRTGDNEGSSTQGKEASACLR
jgi:sugar lactone lactonase YvrE